jgi:hypothetical protein
MYEAADSKIPWPLSCSVVNHINMGQFTGIIIFFTNKRQTVRNMDSWQDR